MMAPTCQKERGASISSDHDKRKLLVTYILQYPRWGGGVPMSLQKQLSNTAMMDSGRGGGCEAAEKAAHYLLGGEKL